MKRAVTKMLEAGATTEVHSLNIGICEDRNTILAALRFYQEQGMGEPANRSDAIHDIATNGGDDISYDNGDIDDLCERVNSTNVRAAASDGNVQGFSRRNAVCQLRSALWGLSRVACRVPGKLAGAALGAADDAYLASFTQAEKAYVLSSALARREAMEPGQYLRETKIDTFDDVVREMGLAYVHSAVTMTMKATTPLELTLSQVTILETYAEGDFAHLANCPNEEVFQAQLEQCGDGLLKFLMVETSKREDCLSRGVTIDRIKAAMRDLDEALDAVEMDQEWMLPAQTNLSEPPRM